MGVRIEMNHEYFKILCYMLAISGPLGKLVHKLKKWFDMFKIEISTNTYSEIRGV